MPTLANFCGSVNPRRKLLLAIRLMSLFTVGMAISATELGQVHFQSSCNVEVQGRFDGALALLHSFEFAEAQRLFGQVEAQDHRCA